MAKTLDELVRDCLGDQVLAILRLQAEQATLKEQLSAAVVLAETAELCAKKSDNKGSSTEEAGPT